MKSTIFIFIKLVVTHKISWFGENLKGPIKYYKKSRFVKNLKGPINEIV